MSALFYRATDPSVGEWYEKFLAADEAFFAAARAFDARYEGHSLMQWESNGRREVTGLNGYSSPGPDWKKDGKLWKPRKGTTVGRALAEEIEAMRFNVGPIPHQAPRLIANGRIFEPGFEKIGDAFWCCWGECPVDVVEDAPHFNQFIWTRAKASEYHLAKEAHEAAKGGAR